MQLISNPINLQYLIGFTGSNGFLLKSDSGNYFFTDFRYKSLAENLQKKPSRLDFEFVLMDENWKESMKKILGKRKTIFFEAAHLSVAELEYWKNTFQKTRWKPCKIQTEKSRLTKDDSEIKHLKLSQKINEQTLERTINLFKKGVAELEIAWKIKTIGHDMGADDISFEPIVAFGANSAVPHHKNTNKKWDGREIILIDMGMKKNGYCSDMTRTFLSKKATAEEIEIYNTVLQAQEKVISEIKAGMKCKKADMLARKEMGTLAEFFGHSLGHGIGLEVHEGPNLSGKSKDTLSENMIVTVEPGIYLEGKFGVRIEDMGRITKNAYENFTKFRK